MLSAVIVAVLAVQSGSSSQTATSPRLIVEVVDSVYQPVPGATVAVVSRSSQKQRYSATTDKDGIARFSVPTGAEYKIEATAIGFKKGRVKSVFLGAGLSTEVGPSQSLADGQVRQNPAPRIQIRLPLARTSTVF
jgi:Carboxypeptidase regulatory-like domain